MTEDISKIKEINSQLEFNGIQRLKSEMASKDDAYSELMDSTTRQVSEMKQKCDQKVKTLVDGFRKDMAIVDSEVSK